MPVGYTRVLPLGPPPSASVWRHYGTAPDLAAVQRLPLAVALGALAGTQWPIYLWAPACLDGAARQIARVLAAIALPLPAYALPAGLVWYGSAAFCRRVGLRAGADATHARASGAPIAQELAR